MVRLLPFPSRLIATLLAISMGAWLIAAEPPPPLEARGFPDIRSYLPREYGSHNQVWTACEAPDGVMYFGTNSEIVSFDGLTWRKIPVPGGAFMRAMAIDENGTVWVGGVDEIGYLKRDHDGKLTFQTLRPHLPDHIEKLGDLRRIHAMADGVYFQTDAYLLRWHDEKFDVWEMHEPYVTLAVAWNDRLIVSREKGWMMPTEVDQWEPFPGDPDPALSMLLSHIVKDGKGGWWASAGRFGLQHFDGETLTPVEGPTAEFLLASRLFGVSRMPDGRLLFPSIGRGLLITDAELNPLVHLTADNGLPSNTVICVSPISESAVWVGTEQGVARLDLSPGLSRFSPLNGLEKNGANAVTRVDGKPVFATTHGTLSLEPGSSHVANPTFQNTHEVDDKLNTFHQLADGSMLVGGLRSMWWVDPEQIVHKLHSPSNITAIHEHPRFPGHVLALHLTGIALWRRNEDGWSDYRPLEDPRGEFQTMSIDASGDVWFGSSNAGVGRLKYSQIPPDSPIWETPDPVVTFYDEDDGLPPIRNQVTVRMIQGEPLFMTAFGLYRFDAATERFQLETRYGEAFADGTWSSHRAAESPLGGVWFEAKAAMPNPAQSFRQFGKALNGEWHPLHVPNVAFVGRLDALECEVINGEEILWICGGEGVIRVNVTRAHGPNPQPVGSTVLHPITTAAGSVFPVAPTATSGLEISPENNSLRFSFGTPGLAGEIESNHQSRLIGFVDGGLESSDTGERVFTNLPAGNYTFEVSARSADHHWALPAQTHFTILHPWWLTPWAKTGFGVIGIGALYLIVRWRTNRLENQRAALEILVAKRTSELAQKAEALERLHELEHDETLAARLAAETARLELLRYQLNPHFLFNSLNSIRALVYDTPEAAGEMVSKLAEFCRRTLSRGGDEMVTLADELEMARNYLDIEQVRWQTGLETQLDIDPPSESCQLPQNLLLPLLENAIKYGGRTSADVLKVRIVTKLTAGELTCIIANTGEWVKPDTNPFTDATQIGLQNLRQRLRRHYQDKASLTHDDSTKGWVIVRITLPCQPPG